MFYRKTLKLFHERIEACWNEIIKQNTTSKTMDKQLTKAMEALEKTVYPGINETREAIIQDREAINKIIAKVWHKKKA